MFNASPPPRSLLSRAAAFALLLLAAASLYADQPMLISLNGGAEVPPLNTSATGTAQITVLPDRLVSGTVKVSGLVPTLAHIHEAAAGKNGPPIITLTQTGNDSFAVPADTRLTSAQYKSYAAGNLYINVHSANAPNGEIRGQLPGKAARTGY